MHGEMRSQYNVYVRVDIHKILQQDRQTFRLGYLEQYKSELESKIVSAGGGYFRAHVFLKNEVIFAEPPAEAFAVDF